MLNVLPNIYNNRAEETKIRKGENWRKGEVRDKIIVQFMKMHKDTEVNVI